MTCNENPASPSGTPPFGRDALGRANDLAALDAVLEQRGEEFVLELTAANPLDACQTLLDALATPALHIMVSDYDAAPGLARRGGPTTLAAAATDLRVVADERFDADSMSVTELDLARVLDGIAAAHLRVAIVDGEIEATDARFMARAAAAGVSPLDAELRARADVEIVNGHTLVIRAREREVLHAVLAETVGAYLAAYLDHDDVDAPPPWMIERLLTVSGRLSIRAAEIDVYATSIDIGVGTTEAASAGPSERSLVYDRLSDTWHDEP